MLDLLAIVLPVFGLIGIGYVARQTGFISERVGEGLSEFVFTLSLPCLIFRTLVRAEIPAVQPWGYWIAYFTGADFKPARRLPAAERTYWNRWGTRRAAPLEV